MTGRVFSPFLVPAAAMLWAPPAMAAALPASLPLLALGPVGWLAFGVLAVATVGLTAAALNHAHQQADSLPDEDAVPCPSCAAAKAKEDAQSAPQDPCKELEQKIRNRQNELVKRYQDMRQDKLNLFGAGPAGVPGAGSWAGHIRQFRSKQINLRSMLNDFAAQGCGEPPDEAWKNATESPPTQPAPR